MNITEVCTAISVLKDPEPFDIIVQILKSQGLIIFGSLIAVPIIVFFIMSELIDIKGRTSKSTLMIIYALILLFSLLLGIISFLVLNVYNGR